MNELTLTDDALLALHAILDAQKVLTDEEQDLLDTVNRAMGRYADRQTEIHMGPY